MARQAARLAIAGVVMHALAFVSLHILEPELSPATAILSEYIGTESSVLARAAFVVFAAIWGALAVALTQEPNSPTLFAGRLLLAFAALAILLGVIYPESLDPRTPSVLSTAQNVLARPGLFLGLVLVSVGLLGRIGWKRRARTLLALAGLAAGLIAVTLGVLLERGLGGVGQRGIFLVLYGWALLVALEINSTGQGASDRRYDAA